MRLFIQNKGMALALTLMFIPLALILAISVAHSIRFGNGYSLQSQQRAKTFYLAESGINIAYRLFQAGNFSTDTHLPDGTPRDDDDLDLLQDQNALFGLERESDGWYVWNWSPGDPVTDSYTQSGHEEEFRFMVQRPTAGTFRVECQASVGSRNETHVLEGNITSMLDFVMFDNGDLADFTGSYDEYLTGDIHSNGDMYLRPFETNGLVGAFEETSNPKLTLTVNSLTSGGKIIRHTDPWGNADDGGTVEVTAVSSGATALMEGYSQGFVGQGNAYDSFHPDWDQAETNPNSAISRWDGAVADRSMGAQTKAAPLRESFEPGGYYSEHAGVKIDAASSGSWVTDVDFYNESEDRLVSVKEVDLQALSSAGAWPANGLLYSEEPLRLVNGHDLAQDLTVVSQSTVYIKGDFNKKFPTQAAAGSGIPAHKKAAILTPDRIYKLTSSFEDKMSSDVASISELIAGANKAEDAPLYPTDESNVLEMNGAFVDGVPNGNARSWVDAPDNPYYVPDNGVLGLDRKVKQVSFNPLSGELKVAFAQAQPYLENLQDVRLVGTGARGHMKLAQMADFDNSNVSNTRTPWLVHTYYVPPKQTIDGEPGKTFEYDPELGTDGGLTGAPFAPRLGRRVRWYRR